MPVRERGQNYSKWCDVIYGRPLTWRVDPTPSVWVPHLLQMWRHFDGPYCSTENKFNHMICQNIIKSCSFSPGDLKKLKTTGKKSTVLATEALGKLLDTVKLWICFQDTKVITNIFYEWHFSKKKFKLTPAKTLIKNKLNKQPNNNLDKHLFNRVQTTVLLFGLGCRPEMTSRS